MKAGNLDILELKKLCGDIREKIINVVLKNGGHLASNLGVVELTVALKKVFNSESDKFLFDVGHQSYVYKLLTGREENFHTLRTRKGIGPFLDPKESPYDNFISGHAGSALSAGVGLAVGNPKDRIIIVVGDASIANGHSLEALNNMINVENIIVVLNDNEMSIGKNVGMLSKFFSKMIHSKTYLTVRKDIKGIVGTGKIGDTMRKAEHSLKSFFFPVSVAENLGLKYFGVVDGHNLEGLIDIFEKIKEEKGPILVHVKTEKGKGYEPAEKNKEKFHGISPYEPNKEESKIYSDIVGEELIKLAENDENIIGISAGMIKGTGLKEFFEKYPKRSFDIGITEGHGVTFAGGLAKAGKKPYFAVYSTFLQRAVGQLIHDISLQNLPIRLLVDRGGIVGEDGKTHNGLHDISLLGNLPKFVFIAPTTEKELREAMEITKDIDTPVGIRYGKNKIFNITGDEKLEIGKWRELIKGEKTLFIGTGSMVEEILKVRKRLEEKNINGTIVSAACISPMDEEYIKENFKNYDNIFVLEEGYEVGGFGSKIINFVNDNNISKKINKIALETAEVEHGKRSELLESYGLSGESLVSRIEGKLNGRG